MEIGMRIDMTVEEATRLAALAQPMAETTHWDGAGIVVADPAEHARLLAILAAPEQVAEAVLARSRAAGLAAVDAEAERQRLRWITGGSGQAMTYARKVEEATALTALLAAGGTPGASDYPMLAACIEIDGDTLAEVAAVVLDRNAMWTVTGAAIEARRLALKRDVAAAASADALAAIDIAAGWPEGAG